MERFDTIVVGAGSAGCVVATRLAERGARVLVLEAGPDYRVRDLPDNLRRLSQAIEWPLDWRNQVTSYNDRLLHYGRGRVTGGSSATNGAVALRAEPPDFDSWPIGWRWADMLPVFCAIETDLDFGDAPHHGNIGPIPIVRWKRDEWAPLQRSFYDACVEVGFAECADHNEPYTTGIGPIPMNRTGRERCSNVHAYLDAARDRHDLTVRGDAHVRRIVFSQRRAVGVELADGSRFAGGDVVLCAGVVQNPLVLWRSGIGPADRVRSLGVEPLADLPAVGANVTDHMVMNYVTPIDPASIPDDAPSIQTILRCSSSSGQRPHDLQLTPFVRRHSDGRRELVVSISLQLPDGHGSITPTAAEPDAPARIDWPFGALASNRRRLHEGFRLSAEIARAMAITLNRTAIERDLALTDAEFDERTDREHYAFYHGVGTCAMGTVVETDGRLRGVDGVRVIDASIAPTVPRANTHLLATAIAERALAL